MQNFAGAYEVVTTPAPWRDFVIGSDRVRFEVDLGDRQLEAELCPVHEVERSEERLDAVAVFHEDVHDPGDATLVYFRLERVGAQLELRVSSNLDTIGREAPVELEARGHDGEAGEGSPAP